MADEGTKLDAIARAIINELAAPSKPAPGEEQGISIRGAFLELLVLALANFYGRLPLSASLTDRAMLKAIEPVLGDEDVGKFATKAEDWIRQEGLVRVQEGQKSYSLNRMSFAVLSTPTSEGLVGELMEKVAHRYVSEGASPELRKHTRALASYFMTRLGRS
jgi:hypothetical protein